MLTAGGATGAVGRGRRILVGDGDTLVDPAARRECSPCMSPSSLSLSRPLPTPRLSVALGTSCCSRGIRVVSSLLLPALFTGGFGESGLGGGMLFDLASRVAICSKCERREDTGFCRSKF